MNTEHVAVVQHDVGKPSSSPCMIKCECFFKNITLLDVVVLAQITSQVEALAWQKQGW